MAVSNQSNPRKSHSLNTSQTIVKKKPANRKKGTLKIKNRRLGMYGLSLFTLRLQLVMRIKRSISQIKQFNLHRHFP